MANGSELCTGLVTRQRLTRQRTEQSCIDIVIFSNDLKKRFKSLFIDNQRKHVLTSIKQTKKGPVIKESDHNVLLAEFKYKIEKLENESKLKVYNLMPRGLWKFWSYSLPHPRGRALAL